MPVDALLPVLTALASGTLVGVIREWRRDKKAEPLTEKTHAIELADRSTVLARGLLDDMEERLAVLQTAVDAKDAQIEKLQVLVWDLKAAVRRCQDAHRAVE